MRPARRGHWRMRDGSTIPIRKMDDNHLSNALRMLKRYGQHRMAAIQNSYMKFPEPSGEHAQDLWESEVNFWMGEAEWFDALPTELEIKFGELEEEAMDRGLEWDVPVPPPKRSRKRR